MGMDRQVIRVLGPLVFQYSRQETRQVLELLRESRIHRSTGNMDYVDSLGDVRQVKGLLLVLTGEDVHWNAAPGHGTGQFPDVNVHAARLALTRSGEGAGVVRDESDPWSCRGVHAPTPALGRSRLMRYR